MLGMISRPVKTEWQTAAWQTGRFGQSEFFAIAPAHAEPRLPSPVHTFFALGVEVSGGHRRGAEQRTEQLVAQYPVAIPAGSAVLLRAPGCFPAPTDCVEVDRRRESNELDAALAPAMCRIRGDGGRAAVEAAAQCCCASG
jgi:hypothetical protein